MPSWHVNFLLILTFFKLLQKKKKKKSERPGNVVNKMNTVTIFSNASEKGRKKLVYIIECFR